jgi:hypothetical protein
VNQPISALQFMNQPNPTSQFVNQSNPANSWGRNTKKLFTNYCIAFSHWISQYRLSLPLGIRGKQILLIVDGHSSRANPSALQYLQKNDISLLILPSHVTHICQPFDLGSQALLRLNIKKLLNRVTKQGSSKIPILLLKLEKIDTFLLRQDWVAGNRFALVRIVYTLSTCRDFIHIHPIGFSKMNL